MPTPLLTTKFHIPSRRADLVPLPRLVERLNDGLKGKLIIVSAPAGFGKTTIVANWIDNKLPDNYHGRVAWLSLDEKDNGLTRFFTYFIAALQNVEPGMGDELRTALNSSQNHQIEILLTLLINEIAAIEKNFVIVLDDYHLISTIQIHQAIQFLLENQPPNLLMVIASRDEPFLPLSRLRARGDMVEIRAVDLRFSYQEAAHYLNQVMSLGLPDDDILALATRTEGWITGLHLAALSMKDQDDPKKFIVEFTGGDRDIIDFLIDEVLSHHSDKSKKFLLRSSILDRLNGSLCAAVTQQEDAQGTLHLLEQENVFIVPLDNCRQWYRYHYLFADVLRQRLVESVSSDEIKKLHQYASQWFEENGLLIEAVEHRFKAEDSGEVIRLIESNAGQMFLNSQLNTLLKWHDQLPHDLIEKHPKLCMIFAWAWVTTGQLEQAEHCLQAAEKALGAWLDDLLVEQKRSEIDAATRGALLETAVVRAQLAIGHEDIPEALKLTGFALPYLADDDGPYLYNAPIGSRMAAYFIQGLAQKLSGDLKHAEKSLIEASVLGKSLNHVHIVALSYGHLANLQATEGHLQQALDTCQHGLREVEEMAGDNSPLSGFLRAEFGNLLYERNDLEIAEQHLQEAIRVAKPWGFLDAFIPGFTGLMRIHVNRGDWNAAFGALDELESLGQNNPSLVKPTVESQRALLWSRQGKLDRAQRWLENAGVDSVGEIKYPREDEFIILAQVLIAQQTWDKATRLIEKLLENTKAGERWGRAIKLLTLKAIAFQAQSNQEMALESVGQAISLAGLEGYARTFVDLGEPMAKLLRMSSSTGGNYVKELLVAFESQIDQSGDGSAVTLVEPMSERELEVLRLLSTELTGPEIARELVIAVSTLRTHTQQIYRKLGVKNRRGALKEAEKLQLL